MRGLIERGEATSAHNAALAVSNRAKGAGSDESKAKRLGDRYRRAYGEIGVSPEGV
jgi:hypothetical protein